MYSISIRINYRQGKVSLGSDDSGTSTSSMEIDIAEGHAIDESCETSTSKTLTASETEAILLAQLKEEPKKVLVGSKSEFRGLLKLTSPRKRK